MKTRDRLGFAPVAVVLTALAMLLLPACGGMGGGARPTVSIGSKKFTESVILGEIAALAAEGAGAKIRHRKELGGTRVLWNALVRGDLDVYAEYTGTLREEIYGGKILPGIETIRAMLEPDGIRMSEPLGFNNTYILGMREEDAGRRGIRRISDLTEHPELVFGFSNEFLDRGDGWPGLRDHYGLAQRDVRGLDHDIAYRSLESGAIDVTDLYSTDAEIDQYGLRRLEDDLRYFTAYYAVYLYRADLEDRAPGVVAALCDLEGRFDESRMAAMNAQVKIAGESERRVATVFLLGDKDDGEVTVEAGWIRRVWSRTREHLMLVAVALAASVLVAIPLGIVAARRARVGQLILGTVGIIQTIPSLALLVFMIPLLGIGGPPAVCAMFLYGLLPIVRNTHAGLRSIPCDILESATALGLSPSARLRLVELPMASRTILAGIKTSAVIAVGTATLGALIGAGGYGQPILTGIRLADNARILEGAIPSAVLAIAVQFLFDFIERLIVPRGLR